MMSNTRALEQKDEGYHTCGTASVAILMCTYRGQSFLTEQLDSIRAQTYPHWKVWVSDDGSDDATINILERYQEKWGKDKLAIISGPQNGFSANFLSLACNPAIKSDFYSFSDQDDFWEPDKLSRAIAWINTVPNDVPALYCARTRLVDENNRHIGFSPLFASPPSFTNALVQSIAGANTMLLNAALLALVRRAGAGADVVSHDWLAYLVATACGGAVFYDTFPTVHYRQHGANLVGSNMSWSARLERIKLLLEGRMRTWNDRNIAALQSIASEMTDDSRCIFDRFDRARHKWLLPRLVGVYRSGVVRQTLWGNIGLVVAAILKKL
jgi:glycosyltransferase involved in cell wall biosynthesis